MKMISQPEAGHTSASLISATVVVFFSTFALLMLQILQTVTLSLQIFHNTAFLVISVCMIGLGGGGSLAAYMRHRGLAITHRTLWVTSLLFACSVLIGGILNSRMHDLEWLIFTSFLPYLFVGLLLPMIFQTWPRHAGRIYFFDLVGSGLGAVTLIYLLDFLGDAGKVHLVVTEVALAGTLAVALSLSRGAVITTGLVALAVAMLFPFSGDLFQYQPAPGKTYGRILRNPDMKSTLDWSKWSYLGRLDSVIPGEGVENFGYFGDWLRDEEGGVSETRLLFASGDNWSSTVDFKGDARYRKRFLDASVPAAPYLFVNEPDVLNIGLGGGIDVFLALNHGARSVVGVEINPLMIEAVAERHPDFFDNPYHDPRMTIHEMDGRTFANQTDDRFDVITLTAVDTGAGLSAGAYVMSENYLYTQEALDAYIRLLKPGGVIFVYRSSNAIVRILSTATESLRKLGIDDPENHFALFGGKKWIGAIIGRDPLPPNDIARLSARIDDGAYGGMRFYLPGVPFNQQTIFKQFIEAVAENREQEFLDSCSLDLAPVYDDMPFFYHHERDFSSSQAGQRLLWILTLVTTGAAFLIILPLLVIRGAAPPRTWVTTLGYFSCIGVGFMLVEIALIQKLVLFLGHPSYSLTVTLFSMLVFSGLGSLAVDRFDRVTTTGLAKVVPGIVAVLAFYAFGLDSLLESFHVSSLVGRAVIVSAVLAPGSVLMGMLLPSMIRLLGNRDSVLICWAWGVNALASVAASVLGVIVSMNWGFTVTLLCGVVCYVGAGAFCLAKGSRRPGSGLISN